MGRKGTNRENKIHHGRNYRSVEDGEKAHSQSHVRGANTNDHPVSLSAGPSQWEARNMSAAETKIREYQSHNAHSCLTRLSSKLFFFFITEWKILPIETHFVMCLLN